VTFRMLNFNIRPVAADDKDWVGKFIAERWGGDFVIAHEVIYYPRKLAGFVAEQEAEKVGLVTYHLVEHSCEIVTIDSTRSNQGVGTALIEAVRTMAQKAGCTRLWLVTTNDNIHALRFYQKRGFELVAVHRNAVTRSRRQKPSIPLNGENGIPIRDEIELELQSACRKKI